MSNDVESKAADVLHWRRSPVPDTQDLQASIIEKTRAMAQKNDLQMADKIAKQAPDWYRFRWLAGVMCAVLVVVSVISLQPDVGVVNPRDMDLITVNDLEWQEVMLLEDELLFAGI